MASSDPQPRVNYWGGQHQGVIKRHGSRTADECASFLYRYLDKLQKDFKFLDLGCGPGSITTDLARKYPHASFTGIDSGAQVIAAAQQFAVDRATPNATFAVGDITALDTLIQWGSFDVVYCHQVLIHMQDAVGGLKTMKRAAKADGGLVAAREAFRGGLTYYPALPALGQWVDIMMDRIDVNGSDSATGQKLIRFALDAGWARSQIAFTVGSNTYSTPEERRMFAESTVAPLRDPEAESRKRLLASGKVDEKKIQEIVDAFAEWQEMEDAHTGFFNGEVVCRNGK